MTLRAIGLLAALIVGVGWSAAAGSESPSENALGPPGTESLVPPTSEFEPIDAKALITACAAGAREREEDTARKRERQRKIAYLKCLREAILDQFSGLTTIHLSLAERDGADMAEQRSYWQDQAERLADPERSCIPSCEPIDRIYGTFDHEVMVDEAVLRDFVAERNGRRRSTPMVAKRGEHRRLATNRELRRRCVEPEYHCCPVRAVRAGKMHITFRNEHRQDPGSAHGLPATQRGSSTGGSCTLSCAEHYRSMAFGTYRESLRDIEPASRHANSHAQPVRRSTLARCQRGVSCGVGPAAHHPGEDAGRRTGVGPDQYRLRPGLDDHRSVPVGLPWAHFRTTKAAVKMHTLLDLRGNIPSFIHISDGKLHDVHALDMLLPEAGAIYVVDRELRRLCPPLCVAPSRGLLRHACQVEHRCSSRLFGADGSLDRHHLRPDHLPGRLLHPSGLPRTSAAHPLQMTPSPARRWSSSPTTYRFRPPPSARSTKAAGRWNSSSRSSSIFVSTARRRTR